MRIRWPGQPLTVRTDLRPGMVGRGYTASLAAVGGRPSYRWAIADDNELPLGLSLEPSTGTISGIPESASEGATSFVVMVTDAEGNGRRSELTLTIRSALKISQHIDVSAPGDGSSYLVELHASGGSTPYRWARAPGSGRPDGLVLDGGTGVISGIARNIGTTHLAVQVTDADGFDDSAVFVLEVRRSSLVSRASGLARRNAATLSPRTGRLSVRIRSRAARRSALGWLHTTTLLSMLAVGLPTVATLFILAYTFARSGPHLIYLGVGMMVGLAAFVIGILTGFLFGIPRAVSSGDLRHKKAASGSGSGSGYVPSSNLAEVSDWLTKLLLGAGLVQLTHLGAPIASLIDDVAAGLHHGQGSQSATVMAGAILIGYATIGLLDGYVVTTVWYPRKISKL
jgi:hypothetical protein